MSHESKTPLVLCLKCRYELSGFQLGDICPECGNEINRLVDQTALSSNKAAVVISTGILSLLIFILTIVRYPSRNTMQWMSVAAVIGLIAIIYNVKVRDAIRVGRAPFSCLTPTKFGNVCGIIGFTLSTIMIVMLIVGSILISIFANNVNA